MRAVRYVLRIGEIFMIRMLANILDRVSGGRGARRGLDQCISYVP